MTSENPQTIAERKEHSNTIGGPFGIILNPLGDISVTAGEACDLSITIINDAPKTPLVNVFVDETSQPVRQWCVLPEQHLALGVGQSSEITFQFEIPIDTASGSYEFVVVIDAPDHYPEDT
ncbi:MAG: transcriptional regulator, partial [Kamptonema sp. SIO4C4]|nr:transcriptional regulator [Kamptonema sp. SIO4C4]